MSHASQLNAEIASVLKRYQKLNQTNIVGLAQDILRVTDKYGLPLMFDETYEVDLEAINEAINEIDNNPDNVISLDEAIKQLGINNTDLNPVYHVTRLLEGERRYMFILNNELNKPNQIEWYKDPRGLKPFSITNAQLAISWLNIIYPLTDKDGKYEIEVAKEDEAFALLIRTSKHLNVHDAPKEFYFENRDTWGWSSTTEFASRLPLERATKRRADIQDDIQDEHNKYNYYVVYIQVGELEKRNGR